MHGWTIPGLRHEADHGEIYISTSMVLYASSELIANGDGHATCDSRKPGRTVWLVIQMDDFEFIDEDNWNCWNQTASFHHGIRRLRHVETKCTERLQCISGRIPNCFICGKWCCSAI